MHKLDRTILERGVPLQITVVGMGGNGSQMLTGLARMHLALQAVGHPGLQVTAYDPDIVTEANIGRQLFSPSDLGRFKSTVLIHRINTFFGLAWKAENILWRQSVSVTPHFLIGCVDTIAARRDLARSHYYYWLDLGNRDRTGQVVLGRHPRIEAIQYDATRPQTFFELFPELNRGRIKEDNTPSCSLAGALERQDLFINQSVVTWALHLLWNFLRNGQTAIHGYYINLESGKTVPIPIQPPPVPAKPVPKSRKSAKRNAKAKTPKARKKTRRPHERAHRPQPRKRCRTRAA